MEEVVIHPQVMAPQSDIQEVVVMPTGTVEARMDPMDVPMKEISASNPHVDSNASDGDNTALLPRNTVRI
jgi:hypothetical protein